MSVGGLSLELDLDAGQFTASIKGADGETQTFAQTLDLTGATVNQFEAALRNVVGAAGQSGAAIGSLRQATESARSAKDLFIASLQRELDTMGMGRDQLLAYRAGQLDATESTQDLRSAIEQQRAALQAQATSTAEAAAGAARLKASQDAFVASLQRQLDTLGMSKQQLLEYGAAQLGITDQTAELRAAIEAKAEADAEAAAATREAATADADAAAAASARKAAADRFVQSLALQIAAIKGGTAAVLEERAAMAGATDAAAPLIAELTQLQAQQREGASAARAVEAALRQQAQAGDRMIASLERQAQSMREQIVAAKGGAGALAEYRAAQAGVGAEAASVIAEIAELDAELGHTTTTAHGSAGAIRELVVVLREFSSGNISRMVGSLTLLMQRLGVATGVVLGAAIGFTALRGLSEPIEKAAESMEKLTLQAQSLGVTVEFLQRLQVASKLTGADINGLTAGIGRLDQAFARARMGSKQQQDAFSALDISLKQNYTNQDLLQAVLSKWGNIADGPRKVTVAMDLFGRSGRDLIPVLDQIASHQAAVNAAMEKYGVGNPEAVSQGQQIAASMREMSIAMQGLGEAFLQVFGPAIRNSVARMSDFLQALEEAIHGTGPLIDALSSATAAATILAAFFGSRMLVTLAETAGAAIAASGAFKELAAGIELVRGAETARDALTALGMTARTTGANLVAMLGSLATGAAVAGVGALAAGVGYLSEQDKVAEHSAEALRDAHANLASALSNALDFATRYHQQTQGLTTAIDAQAGATANSTSKADDATRAAIARANAEKLVTEQILRQAAAQADSDAKSFDRSATGVGVKGWLDRTALSPAGRLMGGIDDNEAKVFQRDLNRQNALYQQAQKAAADARAQAADARSQLLAVQNMKISAASVKTAPGVAGTTDGDPTKTPKAKQNEGESALADLAARAAELQAQLSDTGTQVAKYTALMDDVNSPLGKAVQGHAELRAQILAVADAIDGETEALKGKKVYDDLIKDNDEKQKALNLSLQRGLLLSSGATDVDIERAESLGRVEEAVKAAAEAYAKYNAERARHGLAPVAMPDIRAAATKNESLTTGLSTSDRGDKTLDDMRQRLASLKDEGAQFGTELAAGFKKPDDETVKFVANIDKMVASFQNADPKIQAQAKQLGDQLQQTFATDQLEKFRLGIEETNQSLQTSLIVNDQQRAKAGLDADVGQRRAQIDAFSQAGGDPAQAKQAYADLAQYVQLQNQKILNSNPIQQMANQWSNVTTQMEQATTQWMNSFVDDLMKGKLNFKDFSEQIVEQILEIELKALLAKNVVDPLVSSLGGMFGSLFGGGGGMIDSSAFMGLDQTITAPTIGTGAFASVAHTGGIVGSLNKTRRLDMSAFLGAPRYHSGGIAGLQPGEVPSILQKGEGVFTQNQMKAMAARQNAGNNVAININNQSGQPMDADTGGMKFDGEKYVLNIVTNAMNRPGRLRSNMASMNQSGITR